MAQFCTKIRIAFCLFPMQYIYMYMYSYARVSWSFGVSLLDPRVEKEVRADSKEAKRFFESQPAEKMDQEAGLQTGWG